MNLQYSLSETSETLNIAESGVIVLVRLGAIRPSISIDQSDPHFIVRLTDLTVKTLRRPDQLSLTVQQFGSNAPPFLYLSGLLLTSMHERQSIETCTFETFEGEQVQLFNERRQQVEHRFTSKPTASNNFEFSREEIERYQHSRRYQDFEFKDRRGYQPFNAPKRIDPAAEAIVSLGNRYYNENGIVPATPGALRNYMVNASNNPWEVIDRPNNMRQWMQIEGHPMSYESFSKRFKSYLEDNGG